MNQRLRIWLFLYQYAAGLCDASTGLLLIVAPGWTLRLMRIGAAPQPAVFASYIGVFVLAVGLTYLWVALGWPLSDETRLRWVMQWQISALIRTLVAVFIVWQVVSGGLESRWITVAASDGMFAAIQWFGLSFGWVDRAS
jgi:hypothetical protein